jgi:predicted SprT family Zn-dependent metalloprotease
MDTLEGRLLIESEVKKWLGPDWQVRYFKAARLYGQCRHMGKKNYIRINEHFLGQCSPQQVLELVRHEIAHGLAGRGHGHDALFAKICRHIGAPPASATRIAISVPHKFKLTCLVCGKVYHKYTYKRSWLCGACRGKLKIERLTNAKTG